VDTDSSIGTWLKEAKDHDESNIEVSARRIKALEKALKDREHVSVTYIYDQDMI
jgi:hypothetical protein